MKIPPPTRRGWALHFLLLSPLAVMRIEIKLPAPQAVGSHFETLFAVDNLAALLQGHLYGLSNFDGITGLGRTVVGEILLLHHIYNHVVGTVVDADHLPLIDRVARLTDKLPPVLQPFQSVGSHISLFESDKGAACSSRNITCISVVGVKLLVHNACTAGLGHHLATETDQPPCGHPELNPVVLPFLHHGGHDSLPLLQVVDHPVAVVCMDIHHHLFEGLMHRAIYILQEHLRPRDGKLIPFPSHGLYKNGKLKLAPACNPENIGVIGRFYTDRNVGPDLLLMTILDHVGGYILLFPVGKL